MISDRIKYYETERATGNTFPNNMFRRKFDGQKVLPVIILHGHSYQNDKIVMKRGDFDVLVNYVDAVADLQIQNWGDLNDK